MGVKGLFNKWLLECHFYPRRSSNFFSHHCLLIFLGAVSSSNLAVLIAVPTVSLAVLITICIACVVLKGKNNRAIYDAENPINTMMGKLSGQGELTLVS